MVTSTRAYQCQQCGGAARSVPGRDYMQCTYCRSLVFTVDDPLTVDRITPMGGDLDAECPTCRKTLCMGQIEGRPVLYCGGCYGLLLKNVDFGTITRERRARRADREAEAVKPLDASQYDRRIDCPNCQSKMEVHPYYGPGNIVIDSCGQCQYVWLDHGELRTVERAEGGREPEALPMHINSKGEVTFIPPAPTTAPSGHQREDNPLVALADLLFGF
ncbi:MAG: zf-TFIIB domain-containing protein [Planctomycetaceae bacterium]